MPCFDCARRGLQRDAARRRKLGNVAAGVDLDAALAAYRRRAPFLGNLGCITLEVGQRAEASWSGRAFTTRRKIRVAFGPSATRAEVLEVLVHEMCHLACPPRTGHGERFRLTLRRAARELWGVEVPLLRSSERGEEHNAAYAMDRLIMAALEARIGEVETFPAVVAVAAAPVARVAALVEKRASHAARMLARAENRAKNAARLLSKWRQKVRYYERRAAASAGRAEGGAK